MCPSAARNGAAQRFRASTLNVFNGRDAGIQEAFVLCLLCGGSRACQQAVEGTDATVAFQD